MKAVILAAGLGSRLGEIGNTMPKVMLPIDGKPLLEWHLELLRKNDIKEIFINLYHIPHVVVDYFSDGKKWDMTIHYFYEEKLAGTGGALVKMKPYLNERFFLLYGDIFTNISIKDMEDFHIKKNADISLAIHKTDHPDDSDLVKVTSDMKLKEIYLKPHDKVYGNIYGLAAIYIVEPHTLDLLPAKIPFDFVKHFLKIAFIKKLDLFCYNTQSFMKDIGTTKRYNQLVNLLINDNF